MADVDIMDLFDKEFVTPEESSPGYSSGIQDYKPSRSFQAQKREKSQPAQPVRQDKPSPSSSPDIDEKLVWVGAIFVFFGVFAFLLGYWLGNIKEKEITQVQKQKQAQIVEKLDEQKTEVALKQQALPVQQAQDVVQAGGGEATTAVSSEVPVIPSLAESTAAQAKPVARPQTQPVSKPQETKPAPKAVEKKVVSSSQAIQATRVSAPSTSSTSQLAAGGSFTIQVSAHTALDKAQAVEAQLRQAGFSPYIVETSINDTTYYRVRVGSYTSRADAESALARLKQLAVGRDAYVLSLK